MEKIWFISINDVVHGPLSTEDADRELRKAPHNARSLIWWKGQKQWMNHREWVSHRETILRDRSDSLSGTQRYYFNAGVDTEGPYTVAEIGERLQTTKDIEAVRLWSESTKNWSTLFEMPSLCDRLGITRREHPRVPLVGTVTITKDQFEATLPVVSMSLGGCGVTLAKGVQAPTGVVTVALRSPALFNAIKTRAEIVYAKPDGSVGMKFLSLSTENQSAIVEYVRNFEAERAKVA